MPNRLAHATSPYLQQHRDNPVDWYEWGDEAFERARSEDKPILLSVGYASCHWCHVMAHESFEDPETAESMNRLFVNIKVDREERPDVDAVYMEAVQAMTGRGGWPMTVWLTPDGEPFYAGTYFPKTDRHGMPAFQRVLGAVDEAWRERRDQVHEQASRLTRAIDRRIPAVDQLPGRPVLEGAYRAVERNFDAVNGGFGGAPKFPQQPLLELLLRIHRREWAPKAGPMLRQTLRRMAAGGIFDHVGGGFARYAVDDHWLVPHFEKMLYDNAQLARLYLWAGVELDEPGFLQVSSEVFDYLLRDLRLPEGGFASAEDADSEGEEGRFYVWTDEEFRRVVGSDDADVAADALGVTPEGNFEGSNVLHRALTTAEVAERHGLDPHQVEEALGRARKRLFAARSERVRPELDHKAVAAWNGLALAALADAGAALDRPDLLDAGRACARFLASELRTSDGRLLRSWSRGRPGPPGFLEDYGACAVGLFRLYAATGELEWYRHAVELTEAIPELFSDPEGGFFSTADDAESLIKRPKDQMDNPSPSGNALAAEALLWLSLYTGEETARSHCEDTIRAGGLIIERYPAAAGYLAGVLAAVDGGTREVAVAGPDAHRLARPFWWKYHPEAVLAVDVDGSGADTVPLLAHRHRQGETLAYVCEGFVCEAPVTTPEALSGLLG